MAFAPSKRIQLDRTKLEKAIADVRDLSDRIHVIAGRLDLILRRLEFLIDVSKGASVSSACKKSGISRKTGYEWLRLWATSRSIKDSNMGHTSEESEGIIDLLNKLDAVEDGAWGRITGKRRKGRPPLLSNSQCRELENMFYTRYIRDKWLYKGREASISLAEVAGLVSAIGGKKCSEKQVRDMLRNHPANFPLILEHLKR